MKSSAQKHKYDDRLCVVFLLCCKAYYSPLEFVKIYYTPLLVFWQKSEWERVNRLFNAVATKVFILRNQVRNVGLNADLNERI